MSAAVAVEEKPVMNTTDDDTKTYRGRNLEEVLPQIKAELGPDAEIVRQREGLMGGVGGFFQRPCIEVDARRAAAEPEPEPAPLLPTPAPQPPPLTAGARPQIAQALEDTLTEAGIKRERAQTLVGETV